MSAYGLTRWDLEDMREDDRIREEEMIKILMVNPPCCPICGEPVMELYPLIIEERENHLECAFRWRKEHDPNYGMS